MGNVNPSINLSYDYNQFNNVLQRVLPKIDEVIEELKQKPFSELLGKINECSNDKKRRTKFKEILVLVLLNLASPC